METITNSNVLEYVIEFLCRQDELENRSAQKSLYFQKIERLSDSIINQVKIFNEFGYISESELAACIKMLKDGGIDIKRLEPNGTTPLLKCGLVENQKFDEPIAFNTLEMMVGTINGLRVELKNIDAQPMDALVIQQPNTSLWLNKAYDLCLLMRIKFSESKLGHQKYDFELFRNKAIEILQIEMSEYGGKTISFILAEILNALTKSNINKHFNALQNAEVSI